MPSLVGRLAQHPRRLGAFLFAFVLLVFLPVVGHDFINYDDLGYVTHNAWLPAGFTWANIRHAFVTTELSYWHPLTWLSHLLDVRLFGMHAGGHHFTSALLHAVNAVLVFWVWRRLTGTLWRSWMVAALFALHPMHVESVAWVSERKDVLSTLFLLLALLAYTRWVRERRLAAPRAWRYYALSLLAFAGGLMSKPMVVTLPCVLLLLDWWPLNRTDRSGSLPWFRLFAEKLPFFALSAVISVVTIHAQASIGAMQAVTAYPIGGRILNVLVAYASYVEKCLVPVRLAVFYPFPLTDSATVAIGGMALLAATTVVALVWRRRRPYVLFGWLWFLGTLVPVIGLVQVGGQSMADRYSYVPFIGLFVAMVWGGADEAGALASRRWVPATFAAAVVIAATVLTERQLGYWRNSGTLFRHTIAVTKPNATARVCLGFYYAENPDTLAEACAEYREAIRITPNSAEPHYAFGGVLARRRETIPDAIAEYRTALRLDPKARTHYVLALALRQTPEGRAEATAQLEAAVRLEPGNPDFQRALGDALFSDRSRAPEAIAAYRAALGVRPDWLEVRLMVAGLLADTGRSSEAIAEYETLLRQDPDFAEGHNNLANLLVQDPARAAEAIAEYDAALRLRPDYPEARFNYALFLSRFPERRAAAIAQLEVALKLQPDLQVAHELLARLRAER